MPTPKVEWVRAERRSSNTLGMEMGVALKITPPQAVGTVRTANTRARSARRSLAGPPLRGGRCPWAWRGDSTETTPHPRASAPGREREGAEGDKATERERQEIRVAAAELGTHRKHHGGENEHEEMIERVPDVEEQAHAARGVHGREMITGQVYLRLRRLR